MPSFAFNPARRLLIAMSCLGALAGLTAPAQAQAQKPADLGTVSLGWTKTTAAMSVILAEKIAPKYGLKIESVVFNNAVDISTAMVSGQIDIGLLTSAHLIRAVETDLNIVQIAGNSRGNVTIIASSKLGLAPGDWKGLKEANQKKKLRIASSRGSINELMSIATFAKFGLDANKDFELVNIAAFAQHAQALRSGEFDLVFSTEPNGTQMADEGIGVLFSKTDMTEAGSLHTVFAVKRDWLAKNGAKAKALLSALNEATEWLNADPARTAAEAAKSFPLKPETLQASLKLNRWDLRLAVPETQALARIAAEQKFATKDVSAQIPAAMDNSVLKDIGVQ